MQSKTIKFNVHMEYTSLNDEPIHIKEWWAENEIMEAIQYAIPSMKQGITDVDIELLGIEVQDD